MKTTVRPQYPLAANAFFLQTAFADINVDKSGSVYYWLALGCWKEIIVDRKAWRA